MSITFDNLSPAQLRRAARIKEKIASLEKDLAKLLGAPAASAATPPGNSRRKKKRTLSAEARAKIAAAQRKRWARQKAEAAKAGK